MIACQTCGRSHDRDITGVTTPCSFCGTAIPDDVWDWSTRKLHHPCDPAPRTVCDACYYALHTDEAELERLDDGKSPSPDEAEDDCIRLERLRAQGPASWWARQGGREAYQKHLEYVQDYLDWLHEHSDCLYHRQARTSSEEQARP